MAVTDEISCNEDHEPKVIGVIGMGDMGRMYAKRLSAAGWRVHACDVPAKFEALKEEWSHQKNVKIFPDGFLVSRSSDYIIYSVEAKNIDSVVALYGPATKQGAIVGGQTSCKWPEIDAFEKHLPPDVDIISCHSLHGPGVDTKGQPLVLIQHRAPESSLQLVEKMLSCFGSKYVYLDAETHDHITADTQAVLHAAFLSMGTAWQSNKEFPWENPRYVGGIENIKCNVMLRIYSNKWHVYAGLAILNPSATKQIQQYAKSAHELFTLMLRRSGKKAFAERLRTAGKAVFGQGYQDDLLLQDDVLDRFSLGVKPPQRVRNNHLSLLAMVDCWWKLGIVPYEHMICSTPLFRMWLGMAEYLFRNPDMLEEAIDTAFEDDTFRGDDLAFVKATQAWSDIVELRSMEAYRIKFEGIHNFFKPRFPEANKLGNEMIKTILEKTSK